MNEIFIKLFSIVILLVFQVLETCKRHQLYVLFTDFEKKNLSVVVSI